MSVLTKAQITKAEEFAVNGGTFSFKKLMLMAGEAAAKEITNRCEIKNKKIAVVCGKGNNGGDGYVIASYLKNQGAEISVFAPFGKPKTENAKYYCDKLGEDVNTEFYGDFDIIIDALFGIGFSGELPQNIIELIENINSKNSIRISVDIPSGVECDSGEVKTVGVKADLTLTFIALKPCFVLPNSREYCGEFKVLDIGVPVIDKTYDIIEKPTFKRRAYNSHKGTYGTALLICGSYGMAGAAMLSAKAALRSGLGIARCVIPASICSPITCFLPEAVCVPSRETKRGTLKFNEKLLLCNLKSADAVLFGCGSGTHSDNLKILKFLLKYSDVPIVIDADGINTLAGNIELLRETKAPIILTPHPGEMARLCKTTVKEIEGNRPYFAKLIATKYNCTVVLKGGNTIVATQNGDLSFNVLGNSGMATGGSGDVLAGVIVSILAQGYSMAEAAKFGVYVHSLAGDKAAAKRSKHALIPTDIIEEL